MTFNVETLEGICFTCLNREDEKICKKCMELHAKKTKPGGFVQNNGTDPHFRELWEERK